MFHYICSGSYRSEDGEGIHLERLVQVERTQAVCRCCGVHVIEDLLLCQVQIAFELSGNTTSLASTSFYCNILTINEARCPLI